MYRKKRYRKSRLLWLVSKRDCDFVDFINIESMMNCVSYDRMN